MEALYKITFLPVLKGFPEHKSYADILLMSFTSNLHDHTHQWQNSDWLLGETDVEFGKCKLGKEFGIVTQFSG